MVAVSPINGLRGVEQTDTPVNFQTAFGNLTSDLDTRLIPRFATTTARDAAITSPSEGMASYVTSTAAGATHRCVSVYDGAVWRPRYHGLTIVKTADESVTSSTTFQDDDQLLLALQANSVYAVNTTVFLMGAAANDWTGRLTIPTGATINSWGITGDTAYGNSGSIDVRAYLAESTQTSAYTAGINGFVVHAEIHGIVTVGATAGNVRLQWAQAVSGGTATVVKLGSLMRAERIS